MCRPSRIFGTIILLLILSLVVATAWRSRAECLSSGKTAGMDVMPLKSSLAKADQETSIPLSGAAVTVKIRSIHTEGGLAPAAVRQAVKANLAKLGRSCQEAVKKGYVLPPDITLVSKVGINGQVMGKPLGKPPLADQGFENCLAATLQTLQFPKTKRAATQVTMKLALAAQ